ncbi:MAG: hypothetical protein M1826_003281 [Phylliscum demangeonii]|nr:MAG: hypothetical protein M1826_003281 [Phylliscum demangeonii]
MKQRQPKLTEDQAFYNGRFSLFLLLSLLQKACQLLPDNDRSKRMHCPGGLFLATADVWKAEGPLNLDLAHDQARPVVLGLGAKAKGGLVGAAGKVGLGAGGAHLTLLFSLVEG